MDVKQEILDYIDTEENNGAFLLTGNWGCGKSHIVKDIANELNEKKDHAVGVISLFGVKDATLLNSIIREKYIELKFGKHTKKIYNHIKKIANNGLSIAEVATSHDVAVSAATKGINFVTSYDLFSFYSVKPYIKKWGKSKQFILVLDDFERSLIPLKILMGTINEYSENRKIKTIIVSDEDRIDKKKRTDYLDFKEKLVSRTIRINPDNTEIVHSIINNYKSPNEFYNQFLIDNESVLLSAFRHSGYNNLRSFKSCLLDFERVYSAWKNSNVDMEDIQDVLYKFCVITYEYKKGNYSFGKLYDSVVFFLVGKGESDTEKKDYKNSIKSKYIDEAFDGIFQSLSNWVVNGEWDEELFVSEITKKYIPEDYPSDVRFLNCDFWDLEQKDIDEGMPIVLQKVYDGEMTLDGTVILLQNINMLKQKNIDLPCDIDYSKIANGVEKRKALIRNGKVNEPPRLRDAKTNYIDEEAKSIAEEISLCDLLIYSWKSRRDFISFLKSEKGYSRYGLKGQLLDCFDDELLNLFIEKYDSAPNGDKREYNWALLDFDFYKQYNNQNNKTIANNIQTTLSNLNKLKEHIEKNLKQNSDSIGQFIDTSLIENIKGKIEEIKTATM